MRQKSVFARCVEGLIPLIRSTEQGQEGVPKNSSSIFGIESVFEHWYAFMSWWMQIQSAYDVLSDPEKRKIYDRYGEEGVKQHEAGAQ